MLVLFEQAAMDSRCWASLAPAWVSRRPWPVLRLVSVALVAVGFPLAMGDPAAAAVPPSRVGTCSESFVLSKRFRMVPSPGDQDYHRTTDPFGKEVIISLTNGLRLYFGEGDDYILSSVFAAGHRVRACLQSLPLNCPPGDARGKRYRFVDLQTGARAEGVDSWHLCGGA